VVRWLIRINPLTYGVEALRQLALSGDARTIFIFRVARHAGSVFALHVRSGLRGRQSKNDETRRLRFLST